MATCSIKHFVTRAGKRKLEMRDLPAIVAPTLGGEGLASAPIPIRRWETLLELLRSSGVESVSAAALSAGDLAWSADHPLLLASFDMGMAEVATWSNLLSGAGFEGLLCIRTALLGQDGLLSAETLPFLFGLGITIASVGTSGDPLVDMDIGRLRHELRESRRQMSQACGYPVRVLCPVPDETGRCFDALVIEEARKAGYRLFIGSGEGINDEDALASGRLSARWLTRGARPHEIRDWVVGEGWARRKHRVKDHARRVLRVGRIVRSVLGAS